MKYALVNDTRVEAFPGGKGLCPSCKAEVIAKTGSFRIPHWAHRAICDCDSWSEKETEWHRAWKNKFPAEFQEVIQYDEKSGEKHIADVRTHHGLVIEFQHSHLDPAERAARERFYGNMMWVIDGTRLQRDYPRFLKGKGDLRPVAPGYFIVAFPEECFPVMWLDSSAPVIFDFRGIDQSQSPDEFRDSLWCLLPGRAERNAVVVRMSRDQFVEFAPSRPQLLPAQEILATIAQGIRQQRAAEITPIAQRGYGRFAGQVSRRRNFRRF